LAGWGAQEDRRIEKVEGGRCRRGRSEGEVGGKVGGEGFRFWLEDEDRESD
jgi:hypothetical protein